MANKHTATAPIRQIGDDTATIVVADTTGTTIDLESLFALDVSPIRAKITRQPTDKFDNAARRNNARMAIAAVAYGIMTYVRDGAAPTVDNTANFLGRIIDAPPDMIAMLGEQPTATIPISRAHAELLRQSAAVYGPINSMNDLIKNTLPGMVGQSDLPNCWSVSSPFYRVPTDGEYAKIWDHFRAGGAWSAMIDYVSRIQPDILAANLADVIVKLQSGKFRELKQYK